MKKKLPIFSSEEGRAQYLEAYEQMLGMWTVPYEPLEVKTSYGSTHINVSGPKDGPPLVLLHAAGFSSTAWYANIADFSTHHRVYAVDVIGDAGKSVAELIMEQRFEYAEWLNEVFNGLNIDKGHLLGHSYGGWLAMSMALAYPQRLDKIVLLAPAASLRPFSFISSLALRLAELNIRPPAGSTLKFSASKGTVFEEAFIRQMDLVSKYCVPSTMFPTVYTDDELKTIDLPTLLLIGAEEKIYNPHKALDRANRLMPDLVGEIVPGVSHVLNIEKPEYINTRIIRFLNNDKIQDHS